MVFLQKVGIYETQDNLSVYGKFDVTPDSNHFQAVRPARMSSKVINLDILVMKGLIYYIAFILPPGTDLGKTINHIQTDEVAITLSIHPEADPEFSAPLHTCNAAQPEI